MPRPRGFDEEQVLERAMAVFWKHGFDSTTLDELELATGLGRGSLYGAFGDKRRLFRLAFARYLTAEARGHLAALEAPRAGRPTLIQFFRESARAALADRERRGCLVTNCAIELARQDSEVEAQIGRYLDRFERAFERVVRAAQAKGEIDPHRDPVRLARLLVACLQGLQVLARARPDAAWLDDIVHAVDETLGI